MIPRFMGFLDLGETCTGPFLRFLSQWRDRQATCPEQDVVNRWPFRLVRCMHGGQISAINPAIGDFVGAASTIARLVTWMCLSLG
jgi:hypothetical protein